MVSKMKKNHKTSKKETKFSKPNKKLGWCKSVEVHWNDELNSFSIFFSKLFQIFRFFSIFFSTKLLWEGFSDEDIGKLENWKGGKLENAKMKIKIKYNNKNAEIKMKSPKKGT